MTPTVPKEMRLSCMSGSRGIKRGASAILLARSCIVVYLISIRSRFVAPFGSHIGRGDVICDSKVGSSVVIFHAL